MEKSWVERVLGLDTTTLAAADDLGAMIETGYLWSTVAIILVGAILALSPLGKIFVQWMEKRDLLRIMKRLLTPWHHK